MYYGSLMMRMKLVCVCVSLGTLQRSVLMTHAVARAWLIRSTRAHTQTHIHIYTHTHTHLEESNDVDDQNVSVSAWIP